MKPLFAAAALVLALSVAAHADQGGVTHQGRYAVVFPLSSALPNPQMTPGAIDSRVTQDTLDQTICRRGGYTKSIRPAESYTERLKRRQIRQYGYTDHRLRDYEEDHLISLEVGGSPTDPKNLWPEPHHTVGNWGSYTKDRLENKLHRMVCRHRISLAQAQAEEAGNWIEAYKQYIGPVPKPSRRR